MYHNLITYIHNKHLLYICERTLIILLACFISGVFLLPTEAWGQNTTGDYLTDWLLLGPFDTQTLLEEYPLSGKSPKADMRMDAPDGTSMTWNAYSSPFDFVNLQNIFTSSQALAYGTIHSEYAGHYAVRFGSSGPVRLWVNGQEVFSAVSQREYKKDENVFHLPLKKGSNELLLHIDHWQSDWIFSISNPFADVSKIEGVVRDASGKRVAGAEIMLLCGETVADGVASNEHGYYQLLLPEQTQDCNLKVDVGDQGAWLEKLVQSDGMPIQKHNFRLSKANYLVGHTYMPDGVTPQTNIHLEFLSAETGKLVGTTISDNLGRFSFYNLPGDEFYLRTDTPTGFYYYGQSTSQAVEKVTVHVSQNSLTEEIKFSLPDYRKGRWTTLTPLDGLPHYEVEALALSKDGRLICGTKGGGMCFYNGHAFENLDVRKGLAGNYVNDIEETLEGVIWLGTSNGLTKLEHNVARTIEEKDGLGRLFVNTVKEDDLQTLWIGTEKGLYKKKKEGKFEFVKLSERFPSKDIEEILEDAEGKLWIGTDQGLVVLENNDFEVISELTGMMITSLTQSVDGIMWVGTPEGVYSIKEGILNQYTTNQGLIDNTVDDLCESSDGLIWIATDTGIASFNGHYFINYVRDSGSAVESALSLSCDLEDGSIWVGTTNGLARLDYASSHYGMQDGLVKPVNSNELAGVFSVKLNKDGSVLIGTEWGGLFQLRETELKRILGKDHELYVRNLISTDSSYLWLATHTGIVKVRNSDIVEGLVIENTSHFFRNEEWTMAMSLDDNGDIWTGRGWAGGGLSKYDPDTGEVLEQWTTADGLTEDTIWAIEKAKKGGLWIGSGKGAARFKNGEIKPVSGPPGLSQSEVFSIYEQSPDTVWFAGSNGVFRLEGENWRHFSDQGIYEIVDGEEFLISETMKLPDNIVWSLHQDHQNVMWFGTQSRGAIGYEGTAYTVIDSRNGLIGNQVMSIDSDSTGRLVFGTQDGGITIYHKKTTSPHIAIDKIRVDKKSYQAGEIIPAIIEGKLVSIQYSEIDFSTHSGDRQFLIEIKSEFGEIVRRLTTKQRTFEWMPEAAGSFRIAVYAIDHDLNYSRAAEISLEVVIPFYKKPVFIIFGLVVFIGLSILSAFSTMRSRKQGADARVLEKKMLLQEQEARKNLEAQNALLEKAYQEAEAAKQEAQNATMAKSLFLSNMSHELRTPMNGVIGMVSLLQTTELNEEQSDFVETINDSSEALLTIINDILDFSKIEANKLELDAMPFDLRKCVENILDLLAPAANNKGNHLAYFMPEETPGWIVQDVTRVRQILTNLLSNAIKFTENGHVTLSIETQRLSDEHVQLIFHIQDTGIGIPDDKMDRLFKSFSQVDASTTRRFGGTGLGLSISKQLSALLGGDMSVKSKVGQGSTFSFSIKAELAFVEEETVKRIDPFPGKRVLIFGFSQFEADVLRHHLHGFCIDLIEVNSLDEIFGSYDLIIASQGLKVSSQSQMEKLQSQIKDTPILVVTNRALTIRKPASGRMKKLFFPLKPRQVQHAVYEYLSQRHKKPSALTGFVEDSTLKIDTLSVLVIDDNRFSRKIAARLLESMGCKVALESSHDYAQADIKNRLYDLVLLDVNKDRLDVDLLKEEVSALRLHNESLYVVVMAANMRTEDQEWCMSAGADDLLDVPLRKDDLARILGQVTSHHKVYDGNASPYQ